MSATTSVRNPTSSSAIVQPEGRPRVPAVDGGRVGNDESVLVGEGIHPRPAANQRGCVVGAVDRHHERHGRRSRIARGTWISYARSIPSCINVILRSPGVHPPPAGHVPGVPLPPFRPRRPRPHRQRSRRFHPRHLCQRWHRPHPFLPDHPPIRRRPPPSALAPHRRARRAGGARLPAVPVVPARAPDVPAAPIVPAMPPAPPIPSLPDELGTHATSHSDNADKGHADRTRVGRLRGCGELIASVVSSGSPRNWFSRSSRSDDAVPATTSPLRS